MKQPSDPFIFQEEKKYAYWVVLFLLSCVSIFGVFFYFLKGQYFFVEHTKIHIIFSAIDGLETGSLVKFLGVRVGEVHSIKIITCEELKDHPEVDCSPHSSKVAILTSIDTKVLHLFSSYEHPPSFAIQTLGLLGEKYIEISPAEEVLKQHNNTNQKISSTFQNSLEQYWFQGKEPISLEKLFEEADDFLAVLTQSLTSNKTTFNQTLIHLSEVLKNLHTVMKTSEASSLLTSISELSVILSMLRKTLQKTSPNDIATFMGTLNKLIQKIDSISEKDIKKFFQEEGLRARIF